MVVIKPGKLFLSQLLEHFFFPGKSGGVLVPRQSLVLVEKVDKIQIWKKTILFKNRCQPKK